MEWTRARECCVGFVIIPIIYFLALPPQRNSARLTIIVLPLLPSCFPPSIVPATVCSLHAIYSLNIFNTLEGPQSRGRKLGSFSISSYYYLGSGTRRGIYRAFDIRPPFTGLFFIAPATYGVRLVLLYCCILLRSMDSVRACINRITL